MHPQSREICVAFQKMVARLRMHGMFKTISVLPEAKKELIENMLSSHSERLTIVFGLISTSP